MISTVATTELYDFVQKSLEVLTYYNIHDYLYSYIAI